MRFGSVVWMLGIRYAIAGEMVADASSLPLVKSGLRMGKKFGDVEAVASGVPRR
jgi:hypothetical protein